MTKTKKLLAVAVILVAVIVVLVICFFNRAEGEETVTGGTLVKNWVAHRMAMEMEG